MDAVKINLGVVQPRIDVRLSLLQRKDNSYKTFSSNLNCPEPKLQIYGVDGRWLPTKTHLDEDVSLQEEVSFDDLENRNQPLYLKFYQMNKLGQYP